MRTFLSLEHLLAAGVAEAVYLNTPLETHVPLARAALRVACAVICEKPLAPTAREAEQLAREAERAGVRTAVNFTYRSVPGYRLTERWLAQHGIGEPLHARFELLQGHNFFPGFPRASALRDSGSHPFDLMAALLRVAGLGEIEAVQGAPLSRARPDYGWSFNVRSETGMVAQALFTRSAPGWRNGLRWSLAGDTGALEAELDADRTLARDARPEDGAPQGTWRSAGWRSATKPSGSGAAPSPGTCSGIRPSLGAEGGGNGRDQARAASDMRGYRHRQQLH